MVNMVDSVHDPITLSVSQLSHWGISDRNLSGE